MFKYFDGTRELSDNEIHFLILDYGTHILDDYKKVEYSDCCNVILDFRTHYKRKINICSKCGKDIKCRL